MSRSWLVRVPLTLLLTDEEKAKQGRMTFEFDLVEILGPKRMCDLLRQALADRGWTPRNDLLIKQVGPTRLTIDPTSRTIEVDITAGMQDQIDLAIYDGRDQLAGAPRVIAKEDLDRLGLTSAALSQLEQISKAAGDTLVREAILARREVNLALREVYREALKEKAGTMGNIVSVTESSQQGQLRIRIELT